MSTPLPDVTLPPAGNCAVCDLTILLPAGTQETQLLTCKDCKTRLVVEKIDGENATLTQAPAAE